MRDDLDNGVYVSWLDNKLEIGSVEVNWKKRVELVSFPIPTETPYLSAETREEFLDSIDMSSCESRVKVFFSLSFTRVLLFLVLKHFVRN